MRRSCAVFVVLTLTACATDPAILRERQRLYDDRAEAKWTELRARLAAVQKIEAPSDAEQKIRAWFSESLKDPMSAQIAYAKSGGLICGKVNAKNSYGGYVGAKPFGALLNESGRLIHLNIFELSEHYSLRDTYYPLDEDDAVAALGCAPAPKVNLPFGLDQQMRQQALADQEARRGATKL